MDINDISKILEPIERKLDAFATKAGEESKLAGSASVETKNALDALGVQQRELAERLVAIEQKGSSAGESESRVESWGAQLTKSDRYSAFAGGQVAKLRLEVRNTLTGGDSNVAPDRRPGIVGGAFNPLTIETLLASVPTTSNAVEFTRENAYTNLAAETSEGAAKPESALTWTLVNQPVSTVAHWLKISRQLATDNVALAAYVDTRMRYGVQRKIESQLIVGDGVAPNLGGLMKATNFTAHGYANADLGSTLKKLVLIRKIMADLAAAGFPADAIVLPPAEWADIEISMMTTAAGQAAYSVADGGQPRLFGVPVVASVGMASDTILIGNFAQAATIYNREGVIVEMSDSDSDNFTKNLVTIRAERRLALAVERPAAMRGGDITPA